jgi:hypothetical protein
VPELTRDADIGRCASACIRVRAPPARCLGGLGEQDKGVPVAGRSRLSWDPSGGRTADRIADPRQREGDYGRLTVILPKRPCGAGSAIRSFAPHAGSAAMALHKSRHSGRPSGQVLRSFRDGELRVVVQAVESFGSRYRMGVIVCPGEDL